MNVHGIEKKLENALKHIEKNLSKKNKELIIGFKKECYSHGLSNARVLFYISKLSVMARWTKKDFDKLTKEDAKEIVSRIEEGSYSYRHAIKFSDKHTMQQIRKGKYSEWSKAGYKLTLKKFYQWLGGFEWSSKEYPDKVKWIRTGTRECKLKKPIVLTKEEILNIFQVAKGVREKALVTFMYESGCRCPDELLNMKVSDVEFDDNGALVRLCSGKVGERTIRVIACIPYLKPWIQNHHPSPRSDSSLWVNTGTRNHNKIMGYSSLKKLIGKWVKKAGITKYVTPYTFRRTRYTHLSTKLPTPLLYKYMGQVQGSDVIKRYVALSDEDSDEGILSFYGIKNHNGDGDIKPLFCSRCGKQSPPEKEYCETCNAALTEKAKIEVDEKKKLEMKDLVEQLIEKRVQELIKEKNVS